MSAAPPSEPDVRARAGRAAGLAGEGAQATVWWEWAPGSGGAWGAELVVVRDGRVGSAVAADASEDALRACADAAAAAAGAGPRGLDVLPGPVPGRAHQGYDPAVLREASGRAGLAKVAIAAAGGEAVFEQRSFVCAGGEGLEVAAVGPGGLPADGSRPVSTGGGGPGGTAAGEGAVGTAGAAGTVGAAAGEGEVASRGGGGLLPPALGEVAAVLSPFAVAAVLDRLRPVFGRPGELPLGARVAAACISLSDSPRFAATLPRSYDAHGVPRQPVPLIQDGVAHRLVSLDTGHAVRAGHPHAEPQHFVLVGGGADDEAELMAPIARGVHLVTLDRGVLIEDGRPAGPVDVSGLQVDPLAVLAGAQALTSRQRTIPTAGGARTVGATVCPALRTVRGVRFG